MELLVRDLDVELCDVGSDLLLVNQSGVVFIDCSELFRQLLYTVLIDLAHKEVDRCPLEEILTLESLQAPDDLCVEQIFFGCNCFAGAELCEPGMLQDL